MPYVTRTDQGQQIQIHYEVIGKGESIVFHHGNGNRIQDWHTLGYVKELSSDFQLILIDSRGYGKSSKPHDPAAYSLKSRADDTIAVLDAVGVKRAHCLGGSIGGSICMILARYYPERFKSYILATPYFELFDESIRAALLKGNAAYVAKLEELLGSTIRIPEIHQTFMENDTIAMWAANSSEWFDYRKYAQYMRAPTLIYVGSKEPWVNELVELSKKLPQGEIKILPDADHVTAYWDSQLVAPVIKSFVNKHGG